MSGNGDDRFNLVFAGERLPDTSEAAARRALAAFFGVADPNAMAPFFTGRAVPLRRNLTQRDALRYYRDLSHEGTRLAADLACRRRGIYQVEVTCAGWGCYARSRPWNRRPRPRPRRTVNSYPPTPLRRHRHSRPHRTAGWRWTCSTGSRAEARGRRASAARCGRARYRHRARPRTAVPRRMRRLTPPLRSLHRRPIASRARLPRQRPGRACIRSARSRGDRPRTGRGRPAPPPGIAQPRPPGLRRRQPPQAPARRPWPGSAPAARRRIFLRCGRRSVRWTVGS